MCCQPSCKAQRLFASVLPALARDRVGAWTTPRGRNSTPQKEWRAKPDAPETALRESSLSAININWPQSHEDRDTPVDQDASRPGRQPPQAARE